MIERLKASRRTEGEGGFTLIELLVVIIILGILAAVVVFAVGGVGDKGQSASCKIDTRTVRTAEEAYNANNTGKYAAMGVLVNPGGVLSEPSKYHDVIVTPGTGTTPDSYAIIEKADKSDGTSSCGTLGTAGDATLGYVDATHPNNK